jgi:hypothetical protein
MTMTFQWERKKERMIVGPFKTGPVSDFMIPKSPAGPV